MISAELVLATSTTKSAFYRWAQRNGSLWGPAPRRASWSRRKRRRGFCEASGRLLRGFSENFSDILCSTGNSRRYLRMTSWSGYPTPPLASWYPSYRGVVLLRMTPWRGYLAPPLASWYPLVGEVLLLRMTPWSGYPAPPLASWYPSAREVLLLRIRPWSGYPLPPLASWYLSA